MPDNYWINWGLRVAPPTAISLCYLWAETDCIFLYCSVEIMINNDVIQNFSARTYEGLMLAMSAFSPFCGEF